jgi:hypothetical protein
VRITGGLKKDSLISFERKGPAFYWAFFSCVNSREKTVVSSPSRRFDGRQGLDLPDGVAYTRRVSEDRAMSKRILVVEDQEDLRGVLRDLLTGSGFTVIEAGDGEAGVAKAKSDRPDLILMDIQIPVIDGYEATRRIKLDPLSSRYRSLQ